MAITSLILATPLILVGNYGFNTNSRISIFRLVFQTAHFAAVAIKKSCTNSNWLFFLFARFWYLWAVNAASFFAVLYGVNTVKMSEREVQLVLLLGIVTGIPMGAVWGWITDRLGPLFVMKINVLAWVILLSLAAAIPIFNLPKELWWLVGVFSGTALSGLYASERPFVFSIAPPHQIGEFFGVFNMSGRLAAIAGPFSWGFISVTLGLGQLAAIICLAICALMAFVTILWVRSPKMVRSFDI
jgi:UMF1 family MFS transporter